MFRSIASTMLMVWILACSSFAYAGLTRTDQLVVDGIKVQRSNVAALSSNMFVSASKEDNGKLRLTVWKISSDGKLNKKDTYTAGEVKELDVAVIPSNGPDRQFVTALRDASNELRLITWRVTSSGDHISRLDTWANSSVKIGQVKLTQWHGANDLAAVALTSGEKQLVVWAFEISSTGEIKYLLRLRYTNKLSGGLSANNRVVGFRDPAGRVRLTNFAYKTPSTGDPIGLEVYRGDTLLGSKSDGFDGIEGAGDGAHHVYSLSIAPGTTAVKQGVLCNQRLIVGHGRATLTVWKAPRNWNEPLEKGEGSTTTTSGKILDRPFLSYVGIAKSVKLLALHQVQDGTDEFVTAHSGFGTWCARKKKDRGREKVYLHLWSDKSGPTSGHSNTIDVIGKAEIGGRYAQIDMAQLIDYSDLNSTRFVVALRGKDSKLYLSVWIASGLLD